MYRCHIYFLPLKQFLFYYSKKLFVYHYRLNIPTQYAIVTAVLLVQFYKKSIINISINMKNQ